MSDDKITVRIDEDMERRLDKEELNKSGLVRSLLTNYFSYADTVEAGLQKQLNDKQEEIDNLEREKTEIERKIERKRDEKEQIKQQLKQRRESVPDEVEEFAERIKDGQFKLKNLEPDNPAVENYAQKSGIANTKTFIRKVKDQL